MNKKGNGKHKNTCGGTNGDMMQFLEYKLDTLIDVLARRSILKQEDAALFKKEFQLFPSLKKAGI